MNNRHDNEGFAAYALYQQQREQHQEKIELDRLYKVLMLQPLEEIQKNFSELKEKYYQVNENGFAWDNDCKQFYRIAVESNRWDVVRFLDNEIPPAELPFFEQMIKGFVSQLHLPLEEMKNLLDPNLGNLPRNYIYRVYLHAVKAKRLDVLKFLADDLKIDLVRWDSFGDDDYYNDFEEENLKEVFFAAIDYNDLSMVQWLIGEKKYLTAQMDGPSQDLLEHALFNAEDIDIIKYLVTEENFELKVAGGCLSGEGYQYPKPVTIAIEVGRLDIMKWLVEEQAQTLDDYVAMDVIHTACIWINDEACVSKIKGSDRAAIIKHGRLEILKWLVEEKGLSLMTHCPVVDYWNGESSVKNILETIFQEQDSPSLTFPILAWLLSEHPAFVVECFNEFDAWVCPSNMGAHFLGLSNEELESILVELKGCIDEACLQASDSAKKQLHDLLLAMIETIGMAEAMNAFSRRGLFKEAIEICQQDIKSYQYDTETQICVLSEISRICLAELLLNKDVDPLDEKNSPLNPGSDYSDYLAMNDFRAKRGLQICYLLENCHSPAAKQLKRMAHQFICQNPLQEVSVSEENWPLAAIHCYAFYKLYKNSPTSAFTANLCSRFVKLTAAPAQAVSSTSYRSSELLQQHGSFESSGESRKRKRDEESEDELPEAKRARPEKK